MLPIITGHAISHFDPTVEIIQAENINSKEALLFPSSRHFKILALVSLFALEVPIATKLFDHNRSSARQCPKLAPSFRIDKRLSDR